MRDTQQSPAGPQALFAGLSQRLDDARGLIDSAVPRVRCGGGQNPCVWLTPAVSLVGGGSVELTCAGRLCVNKSAADACPAATPAVKHVDFKLGCLSYLRAATCRALPAFSAGPMRLPTLPKRGGSRAGADQSAQRQKQQRAAGTVVVRSGRFAALIPGDGVIEQVFTSGLGNFL
jgi:hypothetical protein